MPTPEERNGTPQPDSEPEAAQQSFDTLPDPVKDCLREEVSTFLRRCCQQVLSFGLEVDDILRNPHVVIEKVDALIEEKQFKRNKREVIVGRMNELRRKLDETLRVLREQEDRLRQEREREEAQAREEQEQREAFNRWTCEKVYPALRQLADSELRDWSALEEAAEELLPHQKHIWEKLLTEAKAIVERNGTAVDDTPSDQKRFILVLRFLNEHLFMNQGLFLARGPDQNVTYIMVGDESPRRLWDYVRVGVHRLEEVRVYPFRDVEIPTVFARTMHPHSREEFTPRIAYDGFMEAVVIPVNALESHVSLLKALYDSMETPNEELDRELLEAGETQASLAAWKEYVRVIIPQFPDPNQLYFDMKNRTLLEEIRHAVDAKRACARMGRNIQRDSYYVHFGDHVLKQDGQMRSVRNICKEDHEKMMMGISMSELSAQMTAAALSHNHTLMLAEWRKFAVERSHPAFNPDIPRVLAHANASTFALLLLAQELRMIPPVCIQEEGGILAGLKRFVRREAKPFSFEKPDYKRLLPVADALLQRPPQEIRLALKQIYSREFALGEIDEFPFHEITDAGEIRPHERHE